LREAVDACYVSRLKLSSAAKALLRGTVVRSVIPIVLVVLLTSCVPIGVRVQNMLALTG
jgi:hypothetical protein